jgi:pre-mRNA-splicing factor CDC5/CEF1
MLMDGVAISVCGSGRGADVQAAAAAAAEAELKKRSQVLQRGLPRPAAAVASSSAPSVEGPPGGGERGNAERLIAHEMALLVAHDNAAYPIAVRPSSTQNS